MDGKSAFHRLAPPLRRWVESQGWASLREIQEMAIPPILEGTGDVVLSAATAGGKTEAAFLPVCTRIVENPPDGVAVLSISPLKALINDQARRLEGLFDAIGLPVTPWHGDAPGAGKERLRRNPSGALLITPESLESLLMGSSSWCKEAFSGLRNVVVDEFHAFLGTERGCQLQSLLRRIGFLTGRFVPRVALSATLGDMDLVGRALRPNGAVPCTVLVSEGAGSDLLLQVRGYRGDEGARHVTEDLYRLLRGESHLVFANSRARTEELAASLASMSEGRFVPNEFFPHHGSLSPELRQEVERRLQRKDLPTTAVCTSTLELGIDIGSVASIAQVGPPSSVSGLRQRLGRSGRRGSPSVLRVFVEEKDFAPDLHPADGLRLALVQTMAMIGLLLNRWYEPPGQGDMHLSTLVQQTLSVIAQYGGVRADQLWSLLCGSGPFALVDVPRYGELLRSLGGHGLLAQMEDGRLVLGLEGERVVERYTFFTAFSAPEEYRVEHGGVLLGRLPVDRPLARGQRIVFAGRAWTVDSVLPAEKVLMIRPAPGGEPPSFTGSGRTVHHVVRREMGRILSSEEVPPYLDERAAALLAEGRAYYRSSGLSDGGIMERNDGLCLTPWRGDGALNAAVLMLRTKGLDADQSGGVLEVRGCSRQCLLSTVSALLGEEPPAGEALGALVADTTEEKFDAVLPEGLRRAGYAARHLDVPGARTWFAALLERPEDAAPEPGEREEGGAGV